MILSQLKELEKESINRGIPIIGHEKGAWLLEKIKELKPKKILELGTANGYSGIILGSCGAKLTTIEIFEDIAKEAESNFKKFDIDFKIILGDGVIETKKLVGNNTFDLIFIDFQKKKYIEVLEDCIKLVKLNGCIIADNIAMESCQDFKKAVLSHPSLKTEIIDIKDGLSFSKKIK
jgi:predicted O-methyltransferase YrrM